MAIRFCASLEHVKVVLSGMSKMEDLVDNCNTYENFEALSGEEYEFLEKMALKLRENLAVACSECGYCVDACPEMIPIPEYFNLYNTSKNQPESDIYKLYFDKLADEKVPASECTYCGTCVDYCTQKIEIPDELTELVETIAKNTHEVWAAGRIKDGWTYGAKRDDTKKQTPCLVPYEELSEEEKEYDRKTAMETLKLIVKLGYKIEK